MSAIARTMLSFKYNHTKPMVLRLRKRSQNIVTRCKYLVQCYRHKSIAVNAINDVDSVEVDVNLGEHKIMHMMLQKSMFYKNTILPPIKANAIVTSKEIEELYITDWSDKSAECILYAIRKLAYCYLSGSRFEFSLYNDILLELIPKLPSLKNQQIKVLFQCLITLKDETHVPKQFINALDKECINRFFSKNEDLFLISDAFYQLQEHTSFGWRAARKLGSKCSNLSAKELVQLLFLYQGSHLNMFDIEYSLNKCIHELTVNEIAIIARGFFLSKSRIKTKSLLAQIMTKVAKFVPTMSSVYIASIAKLLRYSDSIQCIEEFQNLLKSLHNEIPRLSLPCITHITHAFGSIRVYDEILVNNIIKRVENELNLVRLKDIERLLFSISSVTPFTTYYTDFCRKLLNEVHSSYKTYRSTEVETFPVVLIRILSFATIREIYVQELLELAFTPNFLQKAYKNNLKLLTNEFLTLHCSVKIDLPHYNGPLLGEKAYAHLTKIYNCNDDMLKKESSLKLKTEIVFMCKNKLGINVCADYILPHYPFKEIVFGMDRHNNPVEIEFILSAMPMGSIKSVNNLQEIKWKILFILTPQAKVIGHNGYSGLIYRKFRQLKTIGYTPIPINEQTWNLYTNEQQKENYLKQLIYEENDFKL